MRTIDLYRGIKPPCHEFDPYANPEYQDALMENDKGYKPRVKKETQLKGQMSFADLESDS